MSVRIGINGFGRIGRSVFRILSARAERVDHADIEIVAINDLYENAQLAYLLQYDTVMGRFPEPVRSDQDWLYAGDRRVAMLGARRPELVPWRELGVEIVVEASGAFRSRAELAGHLEAGAQRVILTVPADDEIDATIVIGVNDAALGPDSRIVSNASCTTNCLAPLAMVLDDTFGIEEGFITTVHAYTNDQRLADVPHKDLRRSRAAALNLIPTTTGAARAVGKVLPRLKGKLDGMALRAPVPDGSLVDLAVRLREPAQASEINAALRAAAEGKLRNILEYSEAPLVSTDIVGNPHSSILDALSTVALGDGYARVVAWYDNEWGYSNRVVDLIARLAKL